jgi:2-hydroxy-3-keto-5-methylthiopentenyl-1-phosphate phosphatase
MYDTVLFVDFDGTITEEETLEGVMQRNIDPALYREKVAEMRAGKTSLPEVLKLGFASIPSSAMPSMLSYVRSVPIRAGFEEMLDEMQARSIPVVVISGGLKPYVEDKLAPYRDKLLGVYSVDVDCSGTFMRLVSPYEGQDELLEKTRVMAEYPCKTAICIGDSFTDINMAMASQIVFARDTLVEILKRRGKEFIPWSDFYDVLRVLKG